jgi:hypothetical protein
VVYPVPGASGLLSTVEQLIQLVLVVRGLVVLRRLLPGPEGFLALLRTERLRLAVEGLRQAS